MEEKLYCPICGEEFTRKKWNKKYCSSICARKGHYLKHKDARQKKEAICPVCGKSFQRNGNGKCCSEKCLNIIKGKKERACGVCGKSFVPTHENIKFCSEECRKKKSYRKKPAVEVKKTTLNEIAALARKHGMSYGKYVEALERGVL